MGQELGSRLKDEEVPKGGGAKMVTQVRTKALPKTPDPVLTCLQGPEPAFHFCHSG